MVLAIVALVVFGDMRVSADEATPIHAETVLPQSARFEIVQSTTIGLFTIKLDRYSGKTSQYVNDADGSSVWRSIKIDSQARISTPLTPRFQIFLSGMIGKCAFLLDAVTGATWQLLIADKNTGVLVWVPMQDIEQPPPSHQRAVGLVESEHLAVFCPESEYRYISLAGLVSDLPSFYPRYI